MRRTQIIKKSKENIGVGSLSFIKYIFEFFICLETLAAHLKMARVLSAMMCYDVLEGYVSWIGSWGVLGHSPLLAGQACYAEVLACLLRVDKEGFVQ